MVANPRSSSARPSWTTLFAWTTLAWFGLSVLMAAQGAPWSFQPRAWLQTWSLTAARWVPGLLFTLVVFAVARIAPVRGPRWKQNLLLHAGGALILTGLGVAMQQGLLRALHPDYALGVSYWEGVQSVLRQLGVLFLMLYAGLVGLYHAIDGQSGQPDGSVDDEIGSEGDASAPERLMVRTGDTLVPVPIADIEWIEAADSYVRLHLARGDTHLHRSSMTAMTDRLADCPFLRVHRSTIVRIDAVERLETPSAAGHYEMVLRDGTRRRVSDRYRDDLLDALGAPS